MAKTRRTRAYENTTIAVSKSREQIDSILRKWGVNGISWQDEFDLGRAQLRFKWERDDGTELVARFRVDLPTDEELRETAIDKRNGQFSEKKLERAKADLGKREHRVLLNLLKNMFEAIEAGIMPAEALLLPWIEDVNGETVYEKVEPKMSQLAQKPLHKALTS